MNFNKTPFVENSEFFYKINNFFYKNKKNNILIFGKNNFKKNTIIRYLKECYTNLLKNPEVECVEICLSKKNKSKQLDFLENRLFGLSRFDKSRKIVILYQIFYLNKTEQNYLAQMLEKSPRCFFHILTSRNLQEISSCLKHTCFCFAISQWNCLYRKKFFSDLKITKYISKTENLKRDYKTQVDIYFGFFIIRFLYKNFFAIKNCLLEILSTFLVKNLTYNRVTESIKIETLVRLWRGPFVLKILSAFYHKIFFFLKINSYFKWSRTKILVAKFCCVHFLSL